MTINNNPEAKLFLIPTTLNNEECSSILIPIQQQLIKSIKHFIVETPKIARQHLKTLELDTPIQELHIQQLNKHSMNLEALIAPLKDGDDVGLLSDCGIPAIADPGANVVAMAHQLNIEVVPLIGPCSLILALMASGLNGQNFCFNGYLPIDNAERRKSLIQLSNQIKKNNQTQIMIETPFRNKPLFDDILSNVAPDIKLCVAVNLMQKNQKVITKTIAQWKTQTTPLLQKQEVVFILGL
jgi:16S rRNA (cytidine1402-2'-O)-methyltransferase